IDLDGFKPVNDLYGHQVGDVLLQVFAQRLEQSVRESDTVARLGGDEFVVVLRQIDAPEDAARVARKILAGLRQPFRRDALELWLGASIGIALWPDHGEDAGVLLKEADGAMYAAKQGGRSSYRFHDPATQALAPPRG
ncbi:MAG: GGDEF domain-containing protein, partial [Candidatus Competibacter sp.]|nr:GGDEF domain-containing protein [Candidatus Competibacter sp.]